MSVHEPVCLCVCKREGGGGEVGDYERGVLIKSFLNYSLLSTRKM